MDAHPQAELLEALARGRSAEGAAAGELEGAAAHVATCVECARELSWLRAERELLARRAEAQPALPPALWEGVAARLAREPPQTFARSVRRSARGLAAQRPPRRALAAAVAAACAAAAFALLVRPARVGTGAAPALDASVALRDDAPDPRVSRSLERAEGDCREAARVLEAEYQAGRGNLDPRNAQRWDDSLTRARTQLDGARALAGNDVDARMRVLDGYAAYLRSLRQIVDSSEEAAR